MKPMELPKIRNKIICSPRRFELFQKVLEETGTKTTIVVQDRFCSDEYAYYFDNEGKITTLVMES